MMVRYFRVAGVLDACRRLFAAASLEEQAQIYEREIRVRLWRPALKRVLGGDTVLSLLGVPLVQRLHIERTTGRSIGDFVEHVVASVLTDVPARSNYFWRLYLDGRYSRDRYPRYLQLTHFQRLQAGLVDRVRTDAMLLWRSGGAQVDFVDPLTVRWRGRTRRVGDLLAYDHEQAIASHRRDRVRTYGSFYIARLDR